MANEKRLIDVNALCEFFQQRYEYLRSASENQLPNGFVEVDLNIQVGAIIAKEFLDKAKAAPTVDAAEVIRCQYCGYWSYVADGYGDCSHPRFHLDGHPDPTMEMNGYCSCGERREGV